MMMRAELSSALIDNNKLVNIQYTNTILDRWLH